MTFLRELLFPLIAVLCAFAVGALVVLFIGDSPVETYRLLLGSAFSWPDGIGYTLFFATPLIFTGLAVAVALRGRAAQHRRRRAAVCRRVCDGLGRDQARGPAGCGARAAVLSGSDRRRRRVGRHTGVTQGAIRLARGHQHDHVELHRGRAGGLPDAVSLPDSG